MQNWRITLSYDGTEFFGWQVQPGLRTVQGELQQALERICGEAPLPQGSGRTDAGVHALAQVASFALAAPIPPENLARALNRTLPAAIRVLAAEQAPPEFHARHSAIGKCYEYRVYTGSPCSPFLARYCWAVHWQLDLAALNEAAATILGEHDFTSFAASGPDLSQRNREGAPPNPVRIISHSHWQQAERDTLIYRVHGNGFLHHMVRNLAGTFVDMGRGFLPATDVDAILAAKDRRRAGPTAPASGLFLHHVDYGDSPEADCTAEFLS